MIKRLILNDFKRNKLISTVTCIFMTVSAMLLGLTVLLFGSLLGSIDNLMNMAQTPDFLQMHTGEISEEEIDRFVQNQDMVEEWQICRFLNIENGMISLDGKSLADSTQDNGLCVQGQKFDYLLDMEDKIAKVPEGKVYVPVCYKREYGLEQGQYMQIGNEVLEIAGFFRDSKMNSMMASSKRFLVNEKDYERLKENGSEEYLIEFLLREGMESSVFAMAYAQAGLPANGPTITYPLIRMMNALSDGMMIFVILIVSIVILCISMLCIRFIQLTGLEKDKREIGMLKAVGIARKDIRMLYFAKFLVLSMSGAVAGFILACCLSKPLKVQMQELYGATANGKVGFLLLAIGIVLVEGIMLLGVRRTLKRMEQISAVAALNGRDEAPKGRKQTVKKKNHMGGRKYLLISVVTAACVFLMLVPHNLSSTISSPEFVTYMGIGSGQIRLDVRQTEDILKKTDKIEKQLRRDDKVIAYTRLQTKAYYVEYMDKAACRLLVELGDHSVFPIRYVEGNAPEKEGQLALSVLNAKELDLGLGDRVTMSANGQKQEFTICGIYSDITNGGKTAKAYASNEKLSASDGEPVMWSVFYVSLKPGEDIHAWVSDRQTGFAGEGNAGVKVVDIAEYVSGTYGQTIRQIRLAANVAMGAATIIIFIVVLLFIRLIVERERKDSSLKKAMGYTGREIRMEYLKKSCIYVISGIGTGIIFGNFLGETIAGVILGSMGAAELRFILDFGVVCFQIPVITLAVAMLAVRVGLFEVKKISAYECCIGRE